MPQAQPEVAKSTRIGSLPVAKGTYSVAAYLLDESGLHIWDQAILSDRLRPASDEWAPAILRLDHSWDFESS